MRVGRGFTPPSFLYGVAKFGSEVTLRKLVLLASLAILFFMGLFGRDFWERSRTPAEQFLSTFERRCIPNLLGRYNWPWLRHASRLYRNETTYVDPISEFNVTYRYHPKIEKYSCAVEDDFGRLSLSDRIELDALVEARVPELYPELALDPDAKIDGWEKFFAWTASDPVTLGRWGVIYSRPGGEVEFLTLRFAPGG